MVETMNTNWIPIQQNEMIQMLFNMDMTLYILQIHVSTIQYNTILYLQSSARVGQYKNYSAKVQTTSDKRVQKDKSALILTSKH